MEDEDLISQTTIGSKFDKARFSIRRFLRRAYRKIRKFLRFIVSCIGCGGHDSQGDVIDIYDSNESYETIRNKVAMFTRLHKEGYECCSDAAVGMETGTIVRLGQEEHKQALRIVLASMLKNIQDSTLQMAALDTLRHILQRLTIDREIKMKILSALLKGMEVHLDERELVTNYCEALCTFEIPDDIWHEFKSWAPDYILVWFSGYEDMTEYTAYHRRWWAAKYQNNLLPWQNFNEMSPTWRGLFIGRCYLIALDFMNLKELRNLLNSFWNNTDTCNIPLVFAGHSAGACMAQIMALVMIQQDKYWPRSQILHYGFAQPRCGDENYAALIAHVMRDKSHRLQYKNDFLSNMPVIKAKFNEEGWAEATFNLSRVNHTFWHSGSLVWHDGTKLGDPLNPLLDSNRRDISSRRNITEDMGHHFQFFGFSDPTRFDSFKACTGEGDTRCAPRVCKKTVDFPEYVGYDCVQN